MKRYGMTIPLDRVPLHAQRAWIEELQDLGYTDLWTSEAGSFDGFTPLALASTWAPSMRLGCAIFPAYTRGPGLLAMSVASLAQAAPGRFVMGVGSSSIRPHEREDAQFLKRRNATEDLDDPVVLFGGESMLSRQLWCDQWRHSTSSAPTAAVTRLSGSTSATTERHEVGGRSTHREAATPERAGGSHQRARSR